MLTEVFLTFLVSSLMACLLASLKMLYQSKCATFECGCIRIIRNVDVEEMNDARTPQPNPTPNNQV